MLICGLRMLLARMLDFQYYELIFTAKNKHIACENYTTKNAEHYCLRERIATTSVIYLTSRKQTTTTKNKGP